MIVEEVPEKTHASFPRPCVNLPTFRRTGSHTPNAPRCIPRSPGTEGWWHPSSIHPTNLPTLSPHTERGRSGRMTRRIQAVEVVRTGRK